MHANITSNKPDPAFGLGELGNPNKFTHTGFLRLPDVLSPRGPICVSKSTWWAGVKSGRYPKPVKLSPGVTAWRVEDIFKLIEDASDAA